MLAGKPDARRLATLQVLKGLYWGAFQTCGIQTGFGDFEALHDADLRLCTYGFIVADRRSGNYKRGR